MIGQFCVSRVLLPWKVFSVFDFINASARNRQTISITSSGTLSSDFAVSETGAWRQCGMR
jgi:hypothetical protein